MFLKSKNKNSQRGFTLLEILLVVGIIAILAGIVIVAINPSKQLAQVRNTQRRSDIKQIDSALQQYYIDNNRYPTSTDSGLQEVCDTGSTPYPHDGITCTNLLDLSILVPTYVVAIPKDSQASTTYNSTGYNVYQNPASRKIELVAAKAELDQVIAIGTTTNSVAVVIPEEVGCVATGGDTVDTDSVPGYKIHKFTTVGESEFVVESGPCDVEVLVVAGGGGSGTYYGAGGGGAGGVISTTTSISSTVDVNVGDGGVISNGDDSYFDSLLAVGGGQGDGHSGGSGGGSDYGDFAFGAGTTGQGWAGGNAINWPYYAACGGGGGAGGVGQVGSQAVGHGGNGGVGISSSISGVETWYGGGGGGCQLRVYAPGTGGSGGGGNGSRSEGGGGYIGATSGASNTGGGAGGATWNHFSEVKGGSGIVIVRYAI